jgi:ethanolamine utilization protein EutN
VRHCWLAQQCYRKITETTMQAARVLGQATATMKHPTLKGQRLLIVQPLLADEKTPDAHPLVVMDRLGAARGATVIISSDSALLRDELGSDTPVRWSTIGVRD